MIELIVFVIEGLLLSIYQMPFLFGGDSAEYSAVAHMWGIPHPPGYPLYSLLLNTFQHLFSFLPDYLTINLFSYLPTVLAAIILFKLLTLVTGHRFFALAASSVYIFLFPVLLYSLVPEVFALNILIIALVTYLIVLYNKNKRVKYKYAIAFLIGLAITHHHTFILFVPGWYLLLKEKPLVFLRKNFLSILFFFLLGLSFYLYAPITSHFKPPFDVENAQTLNGFIRLITRASYGTFQSYISAKPNIINQLISLASILHYILIDFRVIGAIFIFLGLLSMWRKKSLLFRFTFVSLLAQLFFMFYINFSLGSIFVSAISERFIIALYFTCIIPFTYGLIEGYNLVLKIAKRYLINKKLTLLLPWFYRVFVVLLVFIYIFSNLRVLSSLRHHDDFDRFAKDILMTPTKKSIVSVSADSSAFTTAYYYYAKKFRNNDLKYISFGKLDRAHERQKIKVRFPNIVIPDNDPDATKFINQNGEKFGIYFEIPFPVGAWYPYGLLWKYYKNEEAAKADKENIIKDNNNLWNNVYRIPSINKQESNILQLKSLQLHYFERLTYFVKLLMNESRYGEAIGYLNRIIHEDSSYAPANRLLMLAYVDLKKCVQAKQYADVFNKHLDDNSLIDVSSISKYLYECQPNNPLIKKYVDKYNYLKTKEDQSLSNL